jgi:hypothetical protein
MQLLSRELSTRSIASKIKKRGCITKLSTKRLLKSLDVAEIAWYHMDHTLEGGTPAHEAPDLNEFDVGPFKLHVFSSILRNGLRRDWMWVLTQDKFMKTRRNYGSMHELLESRLQEMII